MITGLNHLLAETAQPGLPELREVLTELMGGNSDVDRFIEHQTLQPRGQRVIRLRFGANGCTRSLIIKRLNPEIALRNELVATRWLPAIGLQNGCAPLLDKAAARNGECVWHIYEDLGQWELNPKNPQPEQLHAAVELIAGLHAAFAGHPLLGEIRLHGPDFGIHFYESNVRDALAAVQALDPPSDYRALHTQLLDRLHRFLTQLPQRAKSMLQLSGPETMLHGDLWAINVFAIRQGPKWNARLIDWDHAGVGPISYDLSTFLLRFPESERSWILRAYRDALHAAGGELPSDRDLNRIFETHELARFANRLIWPAIAVAIDKADWGWAELAEVEQWFEQFQPIIPLARPFSSLANQLDSKSAHLPKLTT